MSTPTIAELEARVLSGKTVTPTEFASAKAAEEAAVRIGELTEQKRKADELAAKQAKYSALHENLAKEFDAEYESLRLREIGEQIKNLIVEYGAEARRQNAFIYDTTRKVQELRNGCPTASAVVAPSASGVIPQFVSNADRTVVEVANWSLDLQHLVQDAINESNAQAGM
jgi:hypothetical protein